MTTATADEQAVAVSDREIGPLREALLDRLEIVIDELECSEVLTSTRYPSDDKREAVSRFAAAVQTISRMLEGGEVPVSTASLDVLAAMRDYAARCLEEHLKTGQKAMLDWDRKQLRVTSAVLKRAEAVTA